MLTIVEIRASRPFFYRPQGRIPFGVISVSS